MDIAKLFTPNELEKMEKEVVILQEKAVTDEEIINLLANKIAARLPQVQQVIKETRVETQVKEVRVFVDEQKMQALASTIDALKTKQEADRQALFNMTSLSNRINYISGATINNVTITNPSFTAGSITDADIPDSITVSNYLPLSGGSVTGTLNLSADAPIYASSTAQVSGDVRFYGDLTVDGTINNLANVSIFSGDITPQKAIFM